MSQGLWTSPPGWLEQDLARVGELLLATAGASANPLVAEASTHLLKAGGKRVRPVLVTLTAYLGGRPGRSSDLAAAAVELVHQATLYHDDVLDGSSTRRGAPTVHAKWGTEVAILAGDYLFAQGCGLGAKAGGEVPEILARAIAEVCEGQIAETAATGDPGRELSEYRDTIAKKTASLFRAACELGTSTSGAPPSYRESALRFGNYLGMAFQIADDLLDLVGDPAVTGKSPGTDLKEGVFTLPILLARDKFPELRQILAEGAELDRVLPWVERSGALHLAYEQAQEFAAKAEAELDSFPPGPHVEVMRGIVEHVLAQVTL